MSKSTISKQLSDLGFQLGRENENLLAALMFFIGSIYTHGRIDILRELSEFAHKCSCRANGLDLDEASGDDVLNASEPNTPAKGMVRDASVTCGNL